ncbi:hypothetical protein JCM3765_003135 [Sporobolomyces pararoseus]
MTSTPPTTSASGGANVHQYLHLAPSYAQPIQSSSNSIPTTSRLGSASKPSLSSNSAFSKVKNSQDPRPWEEEELRGFVLEYLLSSCYADSAKAFAREVKSRKEEDGVAQEDSESENGAAAENEMEGIEATPPPESWKSHGVKNGESPAEAEGTGDSESGVDELLSREQLKDARLRYRIRESILIGRIAQAITLINTYYPSVLSSPPPSTAPSSPSKLPPFHPLSPKQSNPCAPETFFVLSEPSTSSTSSSSAAPIPVVGSSFGSWATSLSPEILNLNLQLQSFVELMRTDHATSSLSTPSTPTSSVNGLSASATNQDDTGMTSSITSLASSTTSSSLLATAITSSQALLSSIQALPPSKDKEKWERECVDVCGLLAYKDLTNCPVRGYLEVSRREGLAEMVNSAILQRTNRTPLPLLELAARSATAVWSTLAEMKVQFPPIPPTSTTTSSQNGTTKTKVTKTFPSFDFNQFVNENNDPRSPTTDSTDPTIMQS